MTRSWTRAHVVIAVVVGCGVDDPIDTPPSLGPGDTSVTASATMTGAASDAETSMPGSSGGHGTEDTAVDDTDATTGPAVDPCEAIEGVVYTSLGTAGSPSDRPAEQHPDLNLSIRGWSPTGGTLGLVSYGGDTDVLAPHLDTMFTDDAQPPFVANYRVNEWDWATDMAGGPIQQWEVTLVGFGTAAGEVLELPRSGYDIGGGMQARVLFADDDSITLKYTLEDDVVYGYTLHVEGLCVEPGLRARYDADVAAGRAQLPAVTGDQPIGRARGGEIQVAIRDTGAFMDPRSDKDWWDP